jgi:hypothetical protein
VNHEAVIAGSSGTVIKVDETNVIAKTVLGHGVIDVQHAVEVDPSGNQLVAVRDSLLDFAHVSHCHNSSYKVRAAGSGLSLIGLTLEVSAGGAPARVKGESPAQNWVGGWPDSRAAGCPAVRIELPLSLHQPSGPYRTITSALMRRTLP